MVHLLLDIIYAVSTFEREFKFAPLHGMRIITSVCSHIWAGDLKVNS